MNLRRITASVLACLFLVGCTSETQPVSKSSADQESGEAEIASAFLEQVQEPMLMEISWDDIDCDNIYQRTIGCQYGCTAAKGILALRYDDFDQNGTKELLVVRSDAGILCEARQNDVAFLEMYQLQDGRFQKKGMATTENQDGTVGIWKFDLLNDAKLEIESTVFLCDTKEGTTIFLERRDGINIVGDGHGWDAVGWIWKDGQFEKVCEESLHASALSESDEEAVQERLQQLGLSITDCAFWSGISMIYKQIPDATILSSVIRVPNELSEKEQLEEKKAISHTRIQNHYNSYFPKETDMSCLIYPSVKNPSYEEDTAEGEQM